MDIWSITCAPMVERTRWNVTHAVYSLPRVDIWRHVDCVVILRRSRSKLMWNMWFMLCSERKFEEASSHSPSVERETFNCQMWIILSSWSLELIWCIHTGNNTLFKVYECVLYFARCEILQESLFCIHTDEKPIKCDYVEYVLLWMDTWTVICAFTQEETFYL